MEHMEGKFQKETPHETEKLIKEKINHIYNQKKEINPEQIKEIKENLEKIPNLVINFDETLTRADTIRKIVPKLIEFIPEKLEEIKEKWSKFSKMALEYREAKKKGKEHNFNLIKYFYTNVINGINIEDLGKVYDQIIDETAINPNLEKVFEYLKKEQKMDKILLFVLSLNTNQIIEKFYEKNKEFFKKHNVEVIGLVGNQIKTDENGNIIDIYEHVTDQNKKDYIPSQSIMLADDRETKDLVEKDINVVNVQGVKYRPDILDVSIKGRDLQISIDNIKVETSEEGDFLKNLKSQSINKLQEIKLSHENNNYIDILINQYLTFYEESSKLIIEFIKGKIL